MSTDGSVSESAKAKSDCKLPPSVVVRKSPDPQRSKGSPSPASPTKTEQMQSQAVSGGDVAPDSPSLHTQSLIESRRAEIARIRSKIGASSSPAIARTASLKPESSAEMFRSQQIIEQEKETARLKSETEARIRVKADAAAAEAAAAAAVVAAAAEAERDAARATAAADDYIRRQAEQALKAEAAVAREAEEKAARAKAEIEERQRSEAEARANMHAVSIAVAQAEERAARAKVEMEEKAQRDAVERAEAGAAAAAAAQAARESSRAQAAAAEQERRDQEAAEKAEANAAVLAAAAQSNAEAEEKARREAMAKEEVNAAAMRAREKAERSKADAEERKRRQSIAAATASAAAAAAATASATAVAIAKAKAEAEGRAQRELQRRKDIETHNRLAEKCAASLRTLSETTKTSAGVVAAEVAWAARAGPDLASVPVYGDGFKIRDESVLTRLARVRTDWQIQLSDTQEVLTKALRHAENACEAAASARISAGSKDAETLTSARRVLEDLAHELENFVSPSDDESVDEVDFEIAPPSKSASKRRPSTPVFDTAPQAPVFASMEETTAGGRASIGDFLSGLQAATVGTAAADDAQLAATGASRRLVDTAKSESADDERRGLMGGLLKGLSGIQAAAIAAVAVNAGQPTAKSESSSAPAILEDGSVDSGSSSSTDGETQNSPEAPAVDQETSTASERTERTSLVQGFLQGFSGGRPASDSIATSKKAAPAVSDHLLSGLRRGLSEFQVGPTIVIATEKGDENSENSENSDSVSDSSHDVEDRQESFEIDQSPRPALAAASSKRPVPTLGAGGARIEEPPDLTEDQTPSVVRPPVLPGRCPFCGQKGHTAENCVLNLEAEAEKKVKLQREVAAQLEAAAAAKATAEAEELARAQAEAQERARLEAAEAAVQIKAEAEARARREAEKAAQIKAEAEARARREAEEAAQIKAEAEARARREVEEAARAQANAEARARRKAEEAERAQAEADAQARCEAENAAHAKAEVDERARLEVEAATRIKAEEDRRERRNAEIAARARADAEEKVRRQAADAARAQAAAEGRAQRMAAAAAEARTEIEEKLRREAAAKVEAAAVERESRTALNTTEARTAAQTHRLQKDATEQQAERQKASSAPINADVGMAGRASDVSDGSRLMAGARQIFADFRAAASGAGVTVQTPSDESVSGPVMDRDFSTSNQIRDDMRCQEDSDESRGEEDSDDDSKEIDNDSRGFESDNGSNAYPVAEGEDEDGDGEKYDTPPVFNAQLESVLCKGTFAQVRACDTILAFFLSLQYIQKHYASTPGRGRPVGCGELVSSCVGD